MKIGDEFLGFKFDSSEPMGYSYEMDDYLGIVGTVIYFTDNTVTAFFPNSKKTWAYPRALVDKILIKKESTNRFEKLEARVLAWSTQKGIIEHGNALAQCEKTREELNETVEAILQKKLGQDHYYNLKGNLVNTDEEIKDGIGDQFVTIFNQAFLSGLSLLDCLEASVEIIEKRSGKMVGGTFVKDGK